VGQQILAKESWPPPRPLVVIVSCDGCKQVDFQMYDDANYGGDYIKLRQQMHADGWRRRNNNWYRGACIPKGSKEPEEW